MRVIPILPITDALLTSSTVAEPYAPAAYAGGTTYAADAVVSVAADFRNYRSLYGSNTGNTPNISPTWWEVIGYTETAYIGSFNLAGVAITGTAGQFSCTAANLVVGQNVTISGTYGGTGSITGYTNPTTYKISATNGSTTFTLVTSAGTAIVTTAGTPTGLTYLNETLYGLGATVSFGHRIFQSLAAQTVSNALPVSPVTVNANWQDVGPTNKWAMFDVLRNTRTISPSSLTVVVTPGQRVDSFAVMGMRNVRTLHISATSAAYGGTVYDYTVDLSTRTVSNWYEYFFSPFGYKANEAHFDVSPYSDCVITLVLTADSGNVECGAFVLGSNIYIGATQYNAVSDYVNYSTVTRDFAGKVNVMTQRPGVPKTSQQVMIDKERAQFIKDTVTALDATPAVFSGIDDDTSGYFDPLLILGFVTNAPINIGYPDKAMLTLELMEI